MKKILAVTVAVLLIFSAVPALAFSGFDNAPDMPTIGELEENLMNGYVFRVDNEPEVETTPWGENYYNWNAIPDDTPIAVGDKVTLWCVYEIPTPPGSAAEEFYASYGIDMEALSSIELKYTFRGMKDIEIVDAEGLDPNFECDYDAGFCYPLPGYGNASVKGNELTVFGNYGSNYSGDGVMIIIQGTATAEIVECDYSFILGQYELPAHFSVGKLAECEGGYYIYEKDTMNVQIRGMKFLAEDGHFSGYYVCLNDHDYIRNEDGSVFTSVEDPSVVITEGKAFDGLTLAYETFMGFFGFTDDGINDVLVDSVFLDGCEPVGYGVDTYVFGTESGEPDPTEPVEPTDPSEPTDPTDPSEPIAPAPPSTGTISLAVIGAIAIISGAGAVCFRRKED